MMLIGETTLNEIEEHLRCLGGGNHRDNMKRLQRFESYCSVSLTEEEFLELVFLQNDEVLLICPRGKNRTVRAVATRAIGLGQPRLTANWDLAENLFRMREKLGSASIFKEKLVVCQAENDEEQYGTWYIRDGSHRALACATLMLLNHAQYEPQRAYYSMSRRMYESLLNRAT
jgi:hypothetical protein